MVRESRPHEVFVRTVRGEVADGHILTTAFDEVSSDGQRVARLMGPAEGSDARVTSALARDTLVGYMLREGSRFANGRPSTETGMQAASRMRLSFSRADGIAVCALSGGEPVGVSIDSVRRIGPDPLGVSAAICSDHERAILASTPPVGRPWRLLVMWTLKEAIAKAVGLGLRFPLHRIAIGDGRGLSTRVLDVLVGGRGAEWRFATWRPSPLHLCAVAVRCVPGTQIRFAGDLAGYPAGPMPARDRVSQGQR